MVRQTARGWLRVAVRDFAAGGDQKVEVFDNGDEQGRDLHITVDALRVVRMDTPRRRLTPARCVTRAPPVDTGPPAPRPDSGVTPVDAGPADLTPRPLRMCNSLWTVGGATSSRSIPTGAPPRAGCGCGWARPVVACLGQALVGLRRRRR